MLPYTQIDNNRVMPDLADFVTTQEAAALLDYHIEHVRRMAREGDLQGLKIGTTWLINRKSIDSYIRENSKFGKFDRRRGNRVIASQ